MNASPALASDALAPDERCPTGVPGLDEVLGGGLPKAGCYLVQGEPGTGKTTLGMQFLLEGLRRGEAVFQVTLAETKRELVKAARSHGWSLDGIALLELSAIDSLVRAEPQTTVFRPSEMQLGQITDLVVEQVRRTKPARVVFDSAADFRAVAETPLWYRRQLLTLKQEFARVGSTVLLLDDNTVGSDPNLLSFSHGVIRLEQLAPGYAASRRRLWVGKLRGTKHREGYHDYVIARGGVQIHPRLERSAGGTDHAPQPVSSGIPEFDALSGGGLDRGTTTLLTGPAGAGKSTLALHYVVERAAAGEPAIVFAFDETRSLVLHRARSLGLELEKFVTAGVVSLQSVDPAELSPGELASRVRRAVAAGCRLVVIDSLNAYRNALPADDCLPHQLHELCAFLNQRGVITLVIQSGPGFGAPEPSEPTMAGVADTVVVLRYFEMDGEVRRAITVVKKRSGAHEKSIRELRVEPGVGIEVGGPLTQFQGVLTGAPGFAGIPDDTARSGDDRSRI